MLVFPVSNNLHAFESCQLSPTADTEKALVKWVYDGDTLLVTDLKGKNERKIRIIGIDTPEVAHHQQKTQLYGAKAREELRVLLKQHNYKILLEFDKDKHDRYKRELAYTYLANGRSISEWLLQKGYARTLIIPPNVKHANCYRNVERSAQQKKLKLWRLKRNQVKLTSDLKASSKGYIRLKAKVSKFKKQRKTVILELESNSKKPIQLRIKKKNLIYFKNIKLKNLVSQEVVVSGILKNKKGKRTINLNHSSQLDLFPAVKAHKKGRVATLKWSTDK